MKNLVLLLTLALAAAQCSSAPPAPPTTAAAAAPPVAPLPPGFGNYWFRGKAELTSYALSQARYGELHAGEAVLIFVTEDFSRKKQVKLDKPETAGDDKVPVLKLNFEKKFNTGIYPYSLLTSVFVPLDAARDPHPLKVTTSVQEWCGHVFTQLNLRKNQYAVSAKSYFEADGDQETTLPLALLEDELWSRLRLGPAALPTGPVQVVPATAYCRLLHQPLAARAATAALLTGPALQTKDLENRFGRVPVAAYSLEYPEPDFRILQIYFQPTFPYQILGWDETYRDKPGTQTPVLLTTRASRRRILMLDYWRTNHNADAAWRDSLGLKSMGE